MSYRITGDWLAGLHATVKLLRRKVQIIILSSSCIYAATNGTSQMARNRKRTTRDTDDIQRFSVFFHPASLDRYFTRFLPIRTGERGNLMELDGKKEKRTKKLSIYWVRWSVRYDDRYDGERGGKKRGDERHGGIATVPGRIDCL